MGLRFDLRTANWLAHVLDERMPVPALRNEWEEGEAIRMFVSSLENRFYSSPRREWEFENLRSLVESSLHSGDAAPRESIQRLRHFLGKRPWTALLIPAGNGSNANRLLSSRGFLEDLVSIRSEDPGLVLQLEDPPDQVFSLTDVFPAFRTALAASIEWPGVLLWTQQGDSVFLPLGTEPSAIRERARWIFSHLSTAVGLDLSLFKSQFAREFTDVFRPSNKRISILHVSDIHLGSKEANIRLPRVQTMLANLINDIGEYGETVIPLVTGDLMDSPDEDNLDRVRAFLGILKGISTEKPILLLGNHDVRKDGYLSEDLRMAMQISEKSDAVRWFDDFNLAIACFDSVRSGKLARGYIGERQLLDMGSKLDDAIRGKRDFIVLAALHHHPIPVEVPEWYARPFYERVLGNLFEKTDALEDADDFLSFVEARRVAAVLHGHKHIPRLDSTQSGIPVIGCGSSVGKVKMSGSGTFMSINLLSIDTATKTMSARLMAERIAGGGLESYKSHEVIWSPQQALTYRAMS